MAATDTKLAVQKADALVPLPTTPEQRRRASLAVAAWAGRGMDLAEPLHREAVRQRGLPVLEALGLRKMPARAAAKRERAAYGTSECGSFAGYSKHVRLKEPVCEPCKAARREYERGLKTARKQGGGADA